MTESQTTMRDPTPACPPPLRWSLLPLLTGALLLADLPFDLGPGLLRGERPGAAGSLVGPLYWATHAGFGVLLALLWVGADRLFRGGRRPLGWALATGLGALLFSPDGATYFGSAFEFGGALAAQGLAALWPMACGWALIGGLLAGVLRRSTRPLPALALAGLGAGAFGWLLSMLLTTAAALVSRPTGGPVPVWLLSAGGRWCVEGALVGLAVALALPRGLGTGANSRQTSAETGACPH